jgi:hypothetical protein
MLIESGNTLRAQGIAVYNLTRLFAKTNERIYVDSWCHFNALGSRMLAEAVARAILEPLPPLSASRSPDR